MTLNGILQSDQRLDHIEPLARVGEIRRGAALNTINKILVLGLQRFDEIDPGDRDPPFLRQKFELPVRQVIRAGLLDVLVIKLDRADIVKVVPRDHLLLADNSDLPHLFGIDPADVNMGDRATLRGSLRRIFQRAEDEVITLGAQAFLPAGRNVYRGAVKR